jgi:hypothetical protein
MFELNPNHRISMPDIMGHPWLKGETATYSEVIQEFEKRM